MPGGEPPRTPFNAIGQRTSIVRSGSAFSASYTSTVYYNGNGEVAAVNHSTSSRNRAYYFDPIGNREWSTEGNSSWTAVPGSSNTKGGTQTNYNSNTVNEYTSVGGTTFDYDPDGNLEDDGALTYVWDAENRLYQVKDSGTTIARYTYDYLGRRVRKQTYSGAPQGATDRKFIYDGWNLIAEYNTSGSGVSSVQRKYHWGLDVSGTLQGAGGVGGLLKLQDGGTSYYPKYDGNGNIWQWTNGSSVVEKYEYDAFGKITNSGTFSMPVRFSSKFYDEETGLYYYGFRYYDPVHGRWLSRDPIGEEGGLNLYGFVENDSVNKWDNLGLCGTFKVSNATTNDLQFPRGFTVEFDAVGCECSEEDGWEIRLVQAVRWEGRIFSGAGSSRFDILNNNNLEKVYRKHLAGETYQAPPDYTDAWKIPKEGSAAGELIEDSPRNPASSKAYFEVCAICVCKKDQTKRWRVLKCVQFDFNTKTRKIENVKPETNDPMEYEDGKSESRWWDANAHWEKQGVKPPWK